MCHTHPQFSYSTSTKNSSNSKSFESSHFVHRIKLAPAIKNFHPRLMCPRENFRFSGKWREFSNLDWSGLHFGAEENKPKKGLFCDKISIFNLELFQFSWFYVKKWQESFKKLRQKLGPLISVWYQFSAWLTKYFQFFGKILCVVDAECNFLNRQNLNLYSKWASLLISKSN